MTETSSAAGSPTQPNTDMTPPTSNSPAASECSPVKVNPRHTAFVIRLDTQRRRFKLWLFEERREITLRWDNGSWVVKLGDWVSYDRVAGHLKQLRPIFAGRWTMCPMVMPEILAPLLCPSHFAALGDENGDRADDNGESSTTRLNSESTQLLWSPLVGEVHGVWPEDAERDSFIAAYIYRDCKTGQWRYQDDERRPLAKATRNSIAWSEAICPNMELAEGVVLKDNGNLVEIFHRRRKLCYAMRVLHEGEEDKLDFLDTSNCGDSEKLKAEMAKNNEAENADEALEKASSIVGALVQFAPMDVPSNITVAMNCRLKQRDYLRLLDAKKIEFSLTVTHTEESIRTRRFVDPIIGPIYPSPEPQHRSPTAAKHSQTSPPAVRDQVDIIVHYAMLKFFWKLATRGGSRRASMSGPEPEAESEMASLIQTSPSPASPLSPTSATVGDDAHIAEGATETEDSSRASSSGPELAAGTEPETPMTPPPVPTPSPIVDGGHSDEIHLAGHSAEAGAEPKDNGVEKPSPEKLPPHAPIPNVAVQKFDSAEMNGTESSTFPGSAAMSAATSEADTALGRSVWILNLSPSIKSTQLNAMCNQIAPVAKTQVMVKKGKEGRGAKHYGLVTMAVEDDVDVCLEALNNPDLSPLPVNEDNGSRSWAQRAESLTHAPAIHRARKEECSVAPSSAHSYRDGDQSFASSTLDELSSTTGTESEAGSMATIGLGVLPSGSTLPSFADAPLIYLNVIDPPPTNDAEQTGKSELYSDSTSTGTATGDATVATLIHVPTATTAEDDYLPSRSTPQPETQPAFEEPIRGDSAISTPSTVPLGDATSGIDGLNAQDPLPSTGNNDDPASVVVNGTHPEAATAAGEEGEDEEEYSVMTYAVMVASMPCEFHSYLRLVSAQLPSPYEYWIDSKAFSQHGAQEGGNLPEMGDWFEIALAEEGIPTTWCDQADLTEDEKMVIVDATESPVELETPEGVESRAGKRELDGEDRVELLVPIIVGERTPDGFAYCYSPTYPHLLMDYNGLLTGYQAGEKLRVWCAERSLSSPVQWKVVELGPGAERRAAFNSASPAESVDSTRAAETASARKSTEESEPRFHIGLKGLVCWCTVDKRQYVVYCRELNGDVAVLVRADSKRQSLKERDAFGEWIQFDVVKHCSMNYWIVKDNYKIISVERRPKLTPTSRYQCVLMECPILPWTREMAQTGPAEAGAALDEVLAAERFYYSEWVDAIRDPGQLVEKKLASAAQSREGGMSEESPLDAVLGAKVDKADLEKGIEWWVVGMK